MPGCFSCVVAKDASDENTIWVTEVWDSMASQRRVPIFARREERDTSRQSGSFRISRRSPSRARSGELGCQRLTPTNLRTSEGNSDITRLGKSCRPLARSMPGGNGTSLYSSFYHELSAGDA